jgi:hypothetical protein
MIGIRTAPEAMKKTATCKRDAENRDVEMRNVELESKCNLISPEGPPRRVAQ